MKEDRLALLESYKADDIQYFLSQRKSDVIPVDMQEYILQLDSMSRLFHYHKHNYSRAVECLRKEWPQLTIAQARSIYRDALEYFYQDEGISARAWDLKYADAYDDLARLAIKADKLATAKAALDKAHELRTKQREQENRQWQPPIYLVNINVRPEDLGYQSQKLMDIAKRAEDAQYKELILGLETTEAEKKRLLADANIPDADIYGQEPADEQ
ncbi:MAG: hypothetical protein ACI3Z0_03155 [Candidatus Cryptobacteroides sp.]